LFIFLKNEAVFSIILFWLLVELNDQDINCQKAKSEGINVLHQQYYHYIRMDRQWLFAPGRHFKISQAIIFLT
jgi:hypothetical protein